MQPMGDDEDARRRRRRSTAPRGANAAVWSPRVGPQPAVRLTLDEAEHERSKARGSRVIWPGQIEAPRGFGIGGLRNDRQKADENRHAERDVDEERPPPGEVGRQQPPEEGSDRRHAADRRSPDRKRDRPLAAAEHAVDRRQRRGQDHRAADPLQEAAEDQRGRARRGGRHEARDDEPDRPEAEQPAATEHVPDPTERDQQRREDERVDRVDPLGIHRGRVEVPDDRRDRDVDDRRVDDDHRHPERDERHGDPPAAVASGFGRVRGGRPSHDPDVPTRRIARSGRGTERDLQQRFIPRTRRAQMGAHLSITPSTSKRSRRDRRELALFDAGTMSDPRDGDVSACSVGVGPVPPVTVEAGGERRLHIRQRSARVIQRHRQHRRAPPRQPEPPGQDQLGALDGRQRNGMLWRSPRSRSAGASRGNRG